MKRKTSEASAELALSAAEQQNGRFRTALEHAQKAISLRPEMVDAHLAAAVIADNLCWPNPNVHNCSLALQEYQRVLELDASQLVRPSY